MIQSSKIYLNSFNDTLAIKHVKSYSDITNKKSKQSFSNINVNPYNDIAYKEPIHLYENIRNENLANKSSSDIIFKITTYRSIRTKYILLISSLGRSGSSWVGELLSQLEDSFYFFEPDYYYVIVLKQNLNSAEGLKWIKNQMICNFSDDFLEFLWQKWRNHLKFSKKKGKRHKEKLKNKNDMITLCKKSKIRIVKTIRLRIKEVEALFKDEHVYNLQVVYLVRDPRAVLTSRQRLGWFTDPESKCRIMDQDLESYNYLKAQYDHTVYLIRYEDLCRNFIGESSRLWRFLSGNKEETLPESWKRFYQKYTRQPDINSSYGITRESHSEWIKWRKEINNETRLSFMEIYCNNSISSLGYNFFGSLKVARNLNYSSLKSMEN